MKSKILIYTLTLLLAASSCTKPKRVPAPEPKPPAPVREARTTLVLSVGGNRGLAHIGAVDALKRQGVKIHSVFGNSMGAVVGGIYVTAPEQDLAARYRSLIALYQKKIEQGTPMYRKVAIWLRLTELSFENRQFEAALDDLFGRASIEGLPIRFATSYKVREGNTIRDVGRLSGNLAEAIARSANNPFIFKNAELTFIDPGIDRISAVPVEDAFRAFLPDRIIAVNVSGDPIFQSKDVTCAVEEVKINIPQFKSEDELSGAGKNFEWLYKLGFAAMTEALLRQKSISATR